MMSPSRRGFTQILFRRYEKFPDWKFVALNAPSPIMKILTIIARVLLGLIFVVFGSNAFLHFLPMPPLPQGVAGLYLKAFFESGYVYVIGGMQFIAGLLLLIGRFVPLGLTILAAIMFNIWAFHVLMAPEGFPPALVVTVLELFLLWQYRSAFAALLKP
jgi:putative oxidoreductase